MPFIEEENTTKGLPLPSLLTAPTTNDRDFFTETIPDAFNMENTIGSLLNMEDPIGEYDPTFSITNNIPLDREGYTDDYLLARNAEDFNRIDNKITDELEMKQSLHEDDYGWVAMLAAGIADPINLVPLGGVGYKAYKGGQIVKGALQLGTTGFAASSLTESLLYSTQLTRTGGEVALNIAAGTFLTGVLGGAIGAVKASKARGQTSSFDALTRGVEDDMNIGYGGSVGAAAVDELDEATLAAIRKSVDDDVVSGKVHGASKDEEVIQRIYNERLDRKGLRLNPGVRAALKLVGFQDPTIRLIQSKSLAARNTLSGLAENPLARAGDELGGAVEVPVQRLIANWQAPLYESLKQTDNLYTQYVKGFEKSHGSIVRIGLERVAGKHKDKMSFKQFREAVGKAMRNDDIDPIPEVQQLAQHWRKTVFNPLKDAAIKQGLLPEDVKVETAMSYLNRVYKKELIQGKMETPDGTGFVDVTTNWLRRRQDEANLRMGTFEDEAGALKTSARGTRQQIRDVETATSAGVTKAAREEIKKAIDAAIERAGAGSELDIKLPDITAKATAAANKAFSKKFRDELEDMVDLEVRAAISEIADEAVEVAVRDLGEDAPLVQTIRDDITSPLAKEGGEAGTIRSGTRATVDDATIKAIEEEAMIASQKAFERSAKAQAKRLEDLAKNPEAASAAAMAEIKAGVRTEVRNAAQKAARAASKELRKELQKDIKKLTERRKLQFKDEFESRMSAEELRDFAREISERVTGTGGARLPYDVNLADSINKRSVGSALGGPFKQRSFTIPDKDIAEFLESDIEILGRMLVRSMAPDIEIASKFGDVNMTKQLKEVTEDWYRIAKQDSIKLGKVDANGVRQPIDPANPKSRDWAKGLKRDREDLEAIRDRERGVYGLPDNPSHWAYKASTAIRHLNYVRLLGGMSLSAIPDAARPVMVHGVLRAFGDGFIPLITNMGQMSKVMEDIRSFGLATDMVMNSRAQRMAGIQDDIARESKFERGLGTISDTFGMVSLMAPWNTAAKQITGAVSHARMIKAMRNEAAGTISKKEIEYLRSSFIDKRSGKAILKQIDRHGSKEGGMEFSNALKWDDQEAYTIFQSGLGRDIERTIITPGQDIPLWASTPIGKVMFQFKSFAVAATQRMLLSGLQQSDIAAMNGLMLSIALGGLSYAAKEADAGREVANPLENPEKWILEGIDRSGATGWLFEAHNIIEKATRGHIGVGQFFGKQPMSRYASRNMFSAAFGPSAGTFAALLGTAGDIAAATIPNIDGETDEWNDKSTTSFRRLLPYQNLLIVRNGFDKIEESVNNVLGGN